MGFATQRVLRPVQVGRLRKDRKIRRAQWQRLASNASGGRTARGSLARRSKTDAATPLPQWMDTLTSIYFDRLGKICISSGSIRDNSLKCAADKSAKYSSARPVSFSSTRR